MVGGDESERAIRALAERALGRAVARIEPIAPGLGARRFFRLWLEPDGVAPRSLVARVEAPEDPALRPAGVPPEPALEPIRGLLERAGLPVPARVAADPEHGIELLEDVGTRSLEQAALAADARERRALYERALALLPSLQRLDAPAEQVPAFGRRLDAALVRYKASQVIEWAIPWAAGRPAHASERAVVAAAFDVLADEIEAAPRRLAHRDFKAQNLHLVGDDRLVMIDVQGAFLAPPEYDAVALLRDAHVPLPEPDVVAHATALRPRLPDYEAPSDPRVAAETFDRRFTLLTLARNGKNWGRFAYAVRERGDARYAPLVPREAANVRRAAARAAGWDARLARLAELLHSLPEAPACAP